MLCDFKTPNTSFSHSVPSNTFKKTAGVGREVNTLTYHVIYGLPQNTTVWHLTWLLQNEICVSGDRKGFMITIEKGKKICDNCKVNFFNSISPIMQQISCCQVELDLTHQTKAEKHFIYQKIRRKRTTDMRSDKHLDMITTMKEYHEMIM